mgnify:CR=1 FL=1
MTSPQRIESRFKDFKVCPKCGGEFFMLGKDGQCGSCRDGKGRKEGPVPCVTSDPGGEQPEEYHDRQLDAAGNGEE